MSAASSALSLPADEVVRWFGRGALPLLARGHPHFFAAHDLEIVDLLTHPGRALDDGISVTPTLLKLSPLPVQRMVGDLNDRNQVLLTLASQ